MQVEPKYREHEGKRVLRLRGEAVFSGHPRTALYDIRLVSNLKGLQSQSKESEFNIAKKWSCIFFVALLFVLEFLETAYGIKIMAQYGLYN